MKKFLLFAVVAFVTLGASAVERQKKTPLPREQKMALHNQNSFSGLVTKKTAYQFPKAQDARQNVKFVKKAEKTPIQLIPCFSDWTYHYTPIMGGFIFRMMYDGASFCATEDGKVYLKPFGDLDGMIEGTIIKENNMYSDDGADSVVFKCDQIFAKYRDSSNTTKINNLYLEPSKVELNQETGYYPVRSGEKTFGAYYFPEYDNLYIPSEVTLALYEEDAAKTDIFDQYYVVRMLDLYPQEDYLSAMSKATITAKSYVHEEGYDMNYSRDTAVVYMNYQYDENEQPVGIRSLYIQGADAFNKYAWVEFEADKNDPSRFIVSDQYLWDGVIPVSETKESDVLFTTCGFTVDAEADTISGYNVVRTQYGYEYPSYYRLTPNVDGQTYTLKSAENTAYGTFVYFSAAEYMSYNIVDLTVNILMEPVDGIVGVKGGEKKQNNAVYNLAGQRVDRNYKGIVIRNGKKVLVK